MAPISVAAPVVRSIRYRRENDSSAPPIRSPILRAALARELAAGNALVESAGGAGGMPLMVLLAGPFRADHGAELVFREVNVPHWWKAELSDPESWVSRVLG